MSELQTERKDVKVEEILKEVTKKANKKKAIKNKNSVGFIVFILISGILGLLASSLIFNIFSNPFQNQIQIKEFIKKIK